MLWALLIFSIGVCLALVKRYMGGATADFKNVDLTGWKTVCAYEIPYFCRQTGCRNRMQRGNRLRNRKEAWGTWGKRSFGLQKHKES